MKKLLYLLLLTSLATDTLSAPTKSKNKKIKKGGKTSKKGGKKSGKSGMKGSSNATQTRSRVLTSNPTSLTPPTPGSPVKEELNKYLDNSFESTQESELFKDKQPDDNKKSLEEKMLKNRLDKNQKILNSIKIITNKSFILAEKILHQYNYLKKFIDEEKSNLIWDTINKIQVAPFSSEESISFFKKMLKFSNEEFIKNVTKANINIKPEEIKEIKSLFKNIIEIQNLIKHYNKLMLDINKNNNLNNKGLAEININIKELKTAWQKTSKEKNLSLNEKFAEIEKINKDERLSEDIQLKIFDKSTRALYSRYDSANKNITKKEKKHRKIEKSIPNTTTDIKVLNENLKEILAQIEDISNQQQKGTVENENLIYTITKDNRQVKIKAGELYKKFVELLFSPYFQLFKTKDAEQIKLDINKILSEFSNDNGKTFDIRKIKEQIRVLTNRSVTGKSILYFILNEIKSMIAKHWRESISPKIENATTNNSTLQATNIDNNYLSIADEMQKLLSRIKKYVIEPITTEYKQKTVDQFFGPEQKQNPQENKKRKPKDKKNKKEIEELFINEINLETSYNGSHSSSHYPYQHTSEAFRKN